MVVGCVQDYVLRQVDEGIPMAFVRLDLSAAFETVDHNILTNRLAKTAQVRGHALDWMTSFLTDSSQRVKLEKVVSKENKLTCGVPQGSALSPLLFNVYVRPVADVIRKHNLSFHSYADNTQIYFSIKEGILQAVRFSNCMIKLST